jgi:hypothetical protein
VEASSDGPSGHRVGSAATTDGKTETGSEPPKADRGVAVCAGGRVTGDGIETALGSATTAGESGAAVSATCATRCRAEETSSARVADELRMI